MKYCLKCSRSYGGIEDQYEELSKYLESLLEKTIAERVKLIPRKKKNNRDSNQNTNSKQTSNQTSSIISINNSWK